MIVTTTDAIPGKRIVKVVGLVRGNTVRCRNIGKDLTAMMKNITGGEVREYTKLMGECREQALDRMREEAAELGANAVVGTRFMTSEIMEHAAEILVYGTAVLVEND
jgi:uncharacterized protein YbjQ (UPF0145 family)